MFATEELQVIDRKYFTVIVADAYDLTLISNNTKHVWYIRNVELKNRNICLVRGLYDHKAGEGRNLLPAVQYGQW